MECTCPVVSVENNVTFIQINKFNKVSIHFRFEKRKIQNYASIQIHLWLGVVINSCEITDTRQVKEISLCEF